MPLLALWKANQGAIEQFTIEQVVAAAGDGILKDGSTCSNEVREYLAQTTSSKIAQYIEHCLLSSFSKAGMVLQDLINELGRRLDYNVRNGRYQGTTNAIGYDGIWLSPEGHTIVVEIKTTDTYRISLETIIRYRERLIAAGDISGNSSILIVVGRQDTGELEAQVRGSRFAWDIRLISSDALMKLVQLKENTEDPETGRKIRNLLTPVEYTRLDAMVDVMFSTATDVEAGISEAAVHNDDEFAPVVTNDVETKSAWQFTDSGLLQNKREQVFAALSRKFGQTLIKKSRALYWDSAHMTRVACTISKRYTKRSSYPYWYAYHPQWDEFLGDGSSSYFVPACMDLSFAFCIPWNVIHAKLSSLNTTTTDRGTYWHIHITESKPGKYELLLPKGSKNLSIDEFRLALD